MCDSSFLHCSGGRYAFACLRRLVRSGGYPFSPVLPLAARLDYAARSIRGAQAGPLVFRARLPRLGLLRSFARRVLAALLSLVLVINVFVSPRYRAYGFVAALPVLAAGLGFSDFVAIGAATIATVGLGVTGLQGLDLTARDSLIDSLSGSEAVPSSREFFESAYATYQQTGSFGVSAADVPNSVLNSIVDSYTPYLQSFNLPFSMAYVLQNAGGQAILDGVTPTVGAFGGSSWGSPVPRYSVFKGATSAKTYYVFAVNIFASETNNPISIVRYKAFNNSVKAVLNGSGAVQPVARNYSYFPVIEVDNSSGSYSVGRVGSVPDNFLAWAYSPSTYSNTEVNLAAFTGGVTDFSVLSDSLTGWEVSAPSIADTPSAVSDIANGIASGTLSTGAAVGDIRAELANQTIAFNDAIATYGDTLLEAINEGTGDISEGIGTANGLLGQILSALGVSGPIATAIAGVVSGISALPTQLANLLFNTSIQSFSQTAIDSLDDILSQYVSSLPTWLQETGTVLEGLPSNIALAIDGNFGDVITAVNQVLEQVTGIPAEIPEAFGSIITGIPAEVWGEFEGPIGDIIDVLDGVLDGVLGIPRAITDAGASVVTGIGDLTLDIDLSGVLSAIGAIPLSISAALGLDWFIEQAEDLDERLQFDDPSALTLPSATWDDAVGVAQDFADLTPLGPFERFINAVFDVFAGESRRSVSAPRYSISMPNPFGEPFVFVVDFSIFDGTFVSVCHAVFYVCFGFWYFNFVRKLKDSADSYVGELIAARTA